MWIPFAVVSYGTQIRRLIQKSNESHFDSILISVISGLGVFWALALSDTIYVPNISFMRQVLVIAYPIGDALLMALAFIYFTDPFSPRRRNLAIIYMGFAAITLSDAIFITQFANGDYNRLALTNIGYWCSPLLFLYGNSRRQVASAQGLALSNDLALPERTNPIADSLVPYLPLVVLAGVQIFSGLRDTRNAVSNVIIFIAVCVGSLRISKYQKENRKIRTELEQDAIGQSIELARSQLLNQKIIDVAADGILAFDHFEQVSFINQTALDILGHDNLKKVPTRVHDLFHLDPTCDGSCDLSQILHNPFRQNSIIKLTRGLEQRDVELSVRELDGPGSGSVVVLHDITESLSLVRMKDELILLVSHEIRTPLTSIKGSLGLLENKVLGPLSEEAETLVTVARENADRLLRLINDVLDLERMGAGKRGTHVEWRRSMALIDEVVRTMEPLARDANIELHVNGADILVMVDVDQFFQLLTNLIQNAINFSPPHTSIWIEVGVSNNVAVFSVIDEGRGIPKAHLEQIFEAFHQVEASDSRVKTGSGLGLAICREIVTSHGGLIWAEQIPTGGSVIRFSIPRWSSE